MALEIQVRTFDGFSRFLEYLDRPGDKLESADPASVTYGGDNCTSCLLL